MIIHSLEKFEDRRMDACYGILPQVKVYKLVDNHSIRPGPLVDLFPSVMIVTADMKVTDAEYQHMREIREIREE